MIQSFSCSFLPGYFQEKDLSSHFIPSSFQLMFWLPPQRSLISSFIMYVNLCGLISALSTQQKTTHTACPLRQTGTGVFLGISKHTGHSTLSRSFFTKSSYFLLILPSSSLTVTLSSLSLVSPSCFVLTPGQVPLPLIFLTFSYICQDCLPPPP